MRACSLGKLRIVPISFNASEIDFAVFDRVQSYVYGPLEIATKEGARDVVTFLYEASRLVTVFPASGKSEVSLCFKRYLVYSC